MKKKFTTDKNIINKPIKYSAYMVILIAHLEDLWVCVDTLFSLFPLPLARADRTVDGAELPPSVFPPALLMKLESIDMLSWLFN